MDLREFVTSPSGVAFGFAIAALTGVWFGRMNAPLSNFTVVIGIAALAVSVFLHPQLKLQGLTLRFWWTLAVSVPFGLASYYFLWAGFVPLNISSWTSKAIQPQGTVIGGITWSPVYALLRLDISNDSQFPVEDIDLVVKTEQPFVAAGEITQFNAELRWHDLVQVTPEWFEPKTGSRTAMPVDLLASTRGFRITSEKLPRRSRMEIVFAAASVSEYPAAPDKDKVLKVSFASGAHLWYAPKEHSLNVFGARPTISSVNVSGQYSVGGRLHTIAKDIQVTDYMETMMKGIKLPSASITRKTTWTH